MLTGPDIEIRVPPGGLGSEAALPLPASHGVVRFSAGETTITVLATADARALALDRLGPDASGQHDLRGSCDQVRCWSAGSSFEADLRFLDVAAAVSPELASQAAGRLTVWWLSVDHARPGEGWAIADEPPAGDGVSALGPFLDRGSARRWGEMLDDLFELCRYPAELRKAPDGTACAYYEMGRCPAACDGSEPMDAYSARLRSAIGLDADGLRRIAEALQARMLAASSEADFERAGALRDRAEALPSADDRWVQAVGPAVQLGAIAAAPLGRGTRVRLLRVGRSAWRRLGEVDAADADAARELGPMLAHPFEDAGLPAIGGVLARELIRPRRGGPELMPIASGSIDRVWRAVQRAAKIRAHADAAHPEGTNHD